MLRLIATALLAIMALATTACAGKERRAVVLPAADVRAARDAAPGKTPTIHTHDAVVVDLDAVVEVRGMVSGDAIAGDPPMTLAEAAELIETSEGLIEPSEDLRVVTIAPPNADAERAVDAGAWIATGGGFITAVSLLVFLGTVAISGPANDHTDVLRGSGVASLVGLGVAAVGGVVVLGGAIGGRTEPGTLELGPARLSF